MERPAWAPRSIDISVPSVARIYDYYLGGSHNFEVDRQAARRAMEFLPGLPKIMQANRAFMRRAVRFALAEGITQFLDIGSGIPTFGNVHEIAQEASDQARVVYVDNDPVAVAHSKSVLGDDPRTGVVAGDYLEPRSILDSEPVSRLLDLDRPVHEYLALPDPGDARARTITTRHLLGHAGGWRNWRFAPSQALVADFAPGSRWSYSGEGYFFLQRVLEARTGLPVVVNTSLNTAGRPMVDDPRDALELFGSAPVDALVLGPHLVRRGELFGGSHA